MTKLTKEKIREDIEENQSSFKEEYQSLPQAVQNKLAWFQDQKLGVIFHWGLYSVAGIVESWQLSEADQWARKKPWREDISKLQKDYWQLNTQFNPENFEPDRWAELCKKAGFKYMIFTTKHHDGFNMYNTSVNHYKTTDENCPFSINPQADIYGEVVKAFRKVDFGIGAYFSKADWHSPFYWETPALAKDRYASYNPLDKPKLWQKFVGQVHQQLTEICENYGAVDILWLDGGWVSPQSGENIDLDVIIPKLREKNPGLISVDRAVGGQFEDYVTPERKIPESIPKKVWESNIPLAKNWGYVPNDQYKSLSEITKTLVQIIGKGGNVILGIGPKPDGTLPKPAVDLLNGLGKFMDMFGAGLYETRPLFIDKVSNWAFTVAPKTKKQYAFYINQDGNDVITKAQLQEIKHYFPDAKLQNMENKRVYSMTETIQLNQQAVIGFQLV